MSRSRRRNPICGLTMAESEKWWKGWWHRRLRRRVRRALDRGDEVMPHVKEISNPWLAPKDGRQFFDPAEHPELMRK